MANLSEIIKNEMTVEVLRKIIIDWTSSAGGVIAETLDRIAGTIVRVVVIPDTVAQPSNGYALTIRDQQGVDILAGRGASCSDTTTLNICPGLSFTDGTTLSLAPFTINDVLTIAGTGAGNAKKGKIVLYVRLD